VVSESKATHLLSDLSWELANGQEGPGLGLEMLRGDVSKNETLRAPNLMHFKR